MRNVFDQYSQAENRITHALMTALNEDRELLGDFLRDVVGAGPPPSSARLRVLEQQFPGEAEQREDDLDRYGVPDAWIHDDEGWCLVLESKVTAAFRPEQIVSHLRTAERRGFSVASAVSITPEFVEHSALLRSLRWRDVYVWLNQRRGHYWADKAASYLEIAEAKLTELGVFTEGTLTMFAGFPFDDDHPYTYLEAKRLLGLAMAELRSDERLHALGVSPMEQGRGAIRGSKDRRVWDLLPLAPQGSTFTNAPHLTLGVHEESVEAMLTFPHAMDRSIRRRVTNLGTEGFQHCIGAVLDNMKPLLDRYPGMVPTFRGIQRRYRTQTIVRAIDALIEFDLRTAFPTTDGPKHQASWLHTGFAAYATPGISNYQIQIGALLPYRDCPELREPMAVEAMAEVWLACKPLLDVALPTIAS